MKQIIKKIPVVNSIAGAIYHMWINYRKPFVGSKNYWIDRYDSGGNSGDGSYNKLAEFKAEIINAFVRKNNIKTIIEYGCGDGNQLKLAEYLSYIGFDVSPKALSICKEEFMNDSSKTFELMDNYLNETAELTLSLDVIYHLIEDSVFTEYMNRLFDSSEKFVIIYSSDTDVNSVGAAAHVKQRNFSKWVNDMKLEWKLIQHIPNRYPFNGNTKTGSIADFFIYEKA
jgi:SAM-dependent methyltransferase